MLNDAYVFMKFLIVITRKIKKFQKLIILILLIINY